MTERVQMLINFKLTARGDYYYYGQRRSEKADAVCVACSLVLTRDQYNAPTATDMVVNKSTFLFKTL